MLLSDHLLSSVLQCLGGPYFTTELRRTCSVMRRRIEKPARISPSNLLAEAGRQNSIALAEFALRQKHCAEPIHAIGFAAKLGHFDFCDHFRARINDEKHFIDRIIVGSIFSGTAHPLIDVAIPRYNISIKDLTNVENDISYPLETRPLMIHIASANNFQVLESLLKSGLPMDKETALSVAKMNPLERGIELMRNCSEHFHFFFFSGATSCRDCESVLLLMDALSLKTPRAYQHLFLSCSYNNNSEFIKHAFDTMPNCVHREDIAHAYIQSITSKQLEMYSLFATHIIPSITKDHPETLQFFSDRLQQIAPIIDWWPGDSTRDRLRDALEKYAPDSKYLKPPFKRCLIL